MLWKWGLWDQELQASTWEQPSLGGGQAVKLQRRGGYRGDQESDNSHFPEKTHQVQEASPELSPEERRVLERKLKKERKKEEKKRLREAGIAAARPAKGQTPAAKPSAAVLALEYLQGWAQKQESWRFQKTRQTWLLLNMYDEDKVPDEHFSTLLDYLEGLKGSARELTIQKAEALMQELDEADPEARDAGLGKMDRLRQVLQLLS
ncbi:hypothetical protein STEG23_005842 [Scotinomys teguina]